MADFQYFAYGSNLSAARLRLSCPSARLLTTARLPDHRLAFTRRSERWSGGVADILASPGDEAWGAVWLIEDRDADALDRQEGLHLHPPAYERYEVEVHPASGAPLACRSYRVVAPAKRHIAPSRAYLDTMLRGAREVGLPAAYIEALPGVEAPDF